MPTISPYTEGLVIPQYVTTDFDNSLEMALLQKKQGQYNTIVSRLSNLQNSTLNISMLNLKGKQKLDQYNAELSDMLSGDIGDLTDSKIQTRVAGYFNKVAQDTDLKHRSQLSQHYERQLSTIEQMRNSKDPTKSGYNPINEAVFRKWNGGLEDFMMADSVDNWETKQQSYTPYKDIDQKLVNLTKLLHAETQTSQKPVTQKVTINGKEVEVTTGYDVLESTTGISAERIRTLLETTLDQDERSQLDVLSKYRILENSSNEGKMGMYEHYNRWISSETRNTKQQLEQIKAIKSQFDPAKLDPNLPPDELAIKQAQYQSQLDRLNEQEIYLNTKLGQQLTNQMSSDEWMKKSPDEMFPFIRQLTNESYVNGISEAMKWKDEVQKVGMDETYFANLRVKNMQDRLALDAELGRAGLKLREMDLAYKMQREASSNDASTVVSSPADIIKSETSVFENWKAVTDMEKQLSSKVTPIITGKDDKGKYQIDPKNLVNKKWLSENQGNHEVQLWNTFVSMNRDSGAFLDDNKTQPNLAGFEVFKKQVENGDYKNNPAVNQVWSDYIDNKDQAEWLTRKVAKVADVVNREGNVANISNGQTTLGDYAKANRWDGSGEMTFGIPNGKGGYTQMTWTQVKEEYKKYAEANKAYRTTRSVMSSNPLDIAAGLWEEMAMLNPTTANKNYYTGILNNDPAFRSLVGKGMVQEVQSTKLVEEAFANELPQFLQGNQQQTSDEKTIASMIGTINTFAKLADDSSPLGLNPKDITSVSLPVGIGQWGYFMISDKASKNLEGRQLVSVGGQIVKDPQPNTWYRFATTPINQYDVMQNAMFKDQGSVRKNIQGYEVTINDNPNSPYVTLILKGDGQTVSNSVLRKDVSLMFQAAEQYITQLKAQSKPK